MNNPLKIPANTTIDQALELIQNWLEPLAERLFDGVLFKWQLFKTNSERVTFWFRRGPHERDYTAGNQIFVHHPNVVNDQNLSVEPSILGHTIKHSLEICISQTGVYHGQGYLEDTPIPTNEPEN